MYDCCLFDVDGVLVDIRRSYNTAIKKTTEFLLSKLSGRPMRGLVTDRIILKFRQAGGFNNDTDTTYSIVLAMLSKPSKTLAGGQEFLLRVAENADETGINSVENFLSKYGAVKWKSVLTYPAPVKESIVARAFDEFFYGPELFKRRNHLAPKYYEGRPLIEEDVLAVTEATMKKLHEIFGGKLAMVTGRSRLAADYSLRNLMKYFDLDACVFLEDEEREYAKPNPYAIRRAMESMSASTALYAGDSAEDFMMARRAEKEIGVNISFVGIYGYSPEPARTLENFKNLGVEATTVSVNKLPALIKSGL